MDRLHLQSYHTGYAVKVSGALEMFLPRVNTVDKWVWASKRTHNAGSGNEVTKVALDIRHWFTDCQDAGGSVSTALQRPVTVTTLADAISVSLLLGFRERCVKGL